MEIKVPSLQTEPYLFTENLLFHSISEMENLVNFPGGEKRILVCVSQNSVKLYL